MADWWADVLKAVVGAGLGSGAVTLWLDRRKRKGDSTYLAMRLAVVLEAFAEACAEVILNNKNAWQALDDQYPSWEAKLPVLGVYPEDGDGWRALDPHLGSECLNLRNRISTGQAIIFEVGNVDQEGIPDAMRDQASVLGLDAWRLACRLRSSRGLRPITPAYNYAAVLQKAKDRSDAEAAARGQE